MTLTQTGDMCIECMLDELLVKCVFTTSENTIGRLWQAREKMTVFYSVSVCFYKCSEVDVHTYNRARWASG